MDNNQNQNGNGDSSGGSSSGDNPDANASYNGIKNCWYSEYAKLTFDDFCSEKKSKEKLMDEKKQLEEQLHAAQLKMKAQKKEFQRNLVAARMKTERVRLEQVPWKKQTIWLNEELTSVKNQMKGKDELIRGQAQVKQESEMSNNSTTIYVCSECKRMEPDPMAYTDQEMVQYSGSMHETDLMDAIIIEGSSEEENVDIEGSSCIWGNVLAVQKSDLLKKSLADRNESGSDSKDAAKLVRVDLENGGVESKGRKCVKNTGAPEQSPSSSNASRRPACKRRRRGGKSGTTSTRKPLRSNGGARRK